MSRAGNLLRLQEVDLELEARRGRLAAIDATLADSPAVRAAQQKVAEATARFDAARIAVKGLELDVQTFSEKIAEAEARLYGGRISNPKELRDLQQDIASLKRQRGTLEEQQLEALIQSETTEAEVTKSQEALQQAEAETATTKGNLLEERAIVRAAIEKLEGEREARLAPVSASDRELYDNLRRAKKGRAVSRLEEGVCTACGVAPSSSRSQSARQGNELIRCGNCDRILCAE